MNFKKWVKSIQTAGYNGARTVVYQLIYVFILDSSKEPLLMGVEEAFLEAMGVVQPSLLEAAAAS